MNRRLALLLAALALAAILATTIGTEPDNGLLGRWGIKPR